MKNKINKKTIIVVCTIFILSIIVVFLSSINNDNEVISTSASIQNNRKIGWGIKRESDHKEPDLGRENRKVLEDNNGIAIGNSENKYVYLTFDEGYEAGYTEKILEVLKQNDVKAAFFITGHYVNTASDLVQRMISEGHVVGNHTVNHKSMPDLSEEEIKKEVMELHQVMNEKFNYEMKYIRPPKGEFSEKTLQVTNKLGYKTVMWSFAYEDWNENKQPDEERSKIKVIDNLHNGEIMLLHGNSKTNINILDSVIKEAKSMGYEFKSLNEFEK